MSGLIILKAKLKHNYDYLLLKTLFHLVKMSKVSTDCAVLGLDFCRKNYMHSKK